MRRRPSSRLLVLDQSHRVLLFRFVHKSGPLSGRNYWGTPGGGLEAGESFVDAARRELFEETGIRVDTVGQEVANREFVLQLNDGEQVLADERFFLVRTVDKTVSRNNWTTIETEIMTEHRWWSINELISTGEIVFPDGLAAILTGVAREGSVR